MQSLPHQALVSWMRLFYGEGKHRDLYSRLDEPLELSSRTDSTILPNYFEKLEENLKLNHHPPVNGVLTTSMFGTGVDVSRLGIMIVNGQPKTTGSYIQATGRIGRKRGGIAVVFLNSKRPRDLDHYEHYSGFHSALYKHVEPITVTPFAPNCTQIAMGPLSVALLRQSNQLGDLMISPEWRKGSKGAYKILDLWDGTSEKSSNMIKDSPEFSKILQIRAWAY